MDRQTFTIDGRQSREDFGCIYLEGAFKGLFQWAPLKEVATNNWAEENGVEADLSNPVLDSREFSLPLLFDGMREYLAFLSFLSASQYRGYTFIDGMVKMRLRPVSIALPTFFDKRVSAVFKFAHDFPMEGYVYTEPTRGKVPDAMALEERETLFAIENGITNAYLALEKASGWGFDYHQFLEYGVYVLEGTRAKGWQKPARKKPLTRKSKYSPGVLFCDNTKAVYEGADISLNCMIKAVSMEEFIINWNALLYDLTRPKSRMLSGDMMEGTGKYYYKSSSLTKIIADDTGVLALFSIDLVAVNN